MCKSKGEGLAGIFYHVIDEPYGLHKQMRQYEMTSAMCPMKDPQTEMLQKYQDV